MKSKTMMLGLIMVAFAAVMADMPDPVAMWRMDALTADGKIADVSGNGRALTLGGDCYITNLVLTREGRMMPASPRLTRARRSPSEGGALAAFSRQGTASKKARASSPPSFA